MANFYLFKFKTLQARLIIFLLIPVFLILFSGGVLSFLYTREVMLSQWNESADLKLQRAAHYIEMRILKPLELLEVLFEKSGREKSALSSEQIIAFLGAMDGVLGVDFKGIPPNLISMETAQMPVGTMMMGHRETMRFYRSRISPDWDGGRATWPALWISPVNTWPTPIWQ